LKLQKPSRPAASLRQRKANELKTKRKASRRLLVQFVGGGVKISELQTNLSFIRKIIYAHNNASLPLLLPRLSDDSIAVAHHGTRLGLTDEARLGAFVVVRRIVVMEVVVLMMGIQIILSIKKMRGRGLRIFSYMYRRFIWRRGRRGWP
jgi:hypothetical protein